MHMFLKIQFIHYIYPCVRDDLILYIYLNSMFDTVIELEKYVGRTEYLISFFQRAYPH